GFYWLVRTRSSAAVAAATVEIGVLRSGETEPAFHRFTVAIPAGRHPLLIGLTGSDWPDPEERPVAWQVRVLDESAELAHEQSFLWSVPSKSP
ncbi:MAG TPA: hypothetical protein VHF69_01045, partial [Candidatus Synoicihabitans sp.]|nr:hypothetical protein [Candidatus Synoicihabitans sp.]